MRRTRIALGTADPSQAPKIHALITANLEEGHLLPRTLDELTVHAPRFVVATRGQKVVGCAELAPLSQTVAEVRSLAVDRDGARQRRRPAIVDELRRRARREGFDTLCAFTHTPGYFIRMGFSIVPHLWLPEKIHTDCVKCPLFRQCGQYAMVVPLESLRDAERRLPPAVADAAHDRAGRPTGGVDARRAASARPASAPASRRTAIPTSRSWCRTRRPRPPPSSRPIEAQAAPVLVSREHLTRSGGVARAIVVNSGCANACTGDAGLQVARDMAAEAARLVGCPAEQVLVASTGVIGVALPIDKIRAGLPGARARARSRSGARGRTRHHDHRSVPQGGGRRASRSAARRVVVGGMAKGSGMIEPMMATMLGVRHDRRGGAAGAPRPRAARGGRRHVQRDHRRRRVLHERLRHAARQRRERRRVDEARYGAFRRGAQRACAASWRSASSAAARARPSS